METTGDAIRLASKLGKTPNWDKLTKEALMSKLQTSGESVGLPKGQMGNSEVGHTHIGAGRIVKQSLTRINEAIKSGEFFKNEGLEAFVTEFKKKKKQGVVHVAGIVSSGGVHGSDKHVLATLKFFHYRGLRVKLHAFLDGRDTKPQAAIEEMPRFLEECEKIGLGEDVLASVMGRYYAMDRDGRWERTRLAFRTMQFGEGVLSEWLRIGDGRKKLEVALGEIYLLRKDGDEFIKPFVCGNYAGFSEGDALFFTNFREDRMLQIAMYCAEDILVKAMDAFSMRDGYHLPHPIGWMMPYESRESFNGFYTAFKKEPIKDSLDACLSKAGLKQLRIAETEKFPHVSYFLDGGQEETFEKGKYILVDSPTKQATYDLKPEMAAYEIVGRFVSNFPKRVFSQQEDCSLFVLNYANPDMVGHTGDLEATIEAIAAVDACLGTMIDKIKDSPKKAGLMIFADHGNAEQMIDENGGPHTSHTTNPVPLVITGSLSANLTKDSFALANGNLTDIAPTALYLLGLDKPEVMTGHSLLTKK